MGVAEEESAAGAVPLQLEDEGLLQEQGWVYPPRVQLLLAVSTDPEEDSRYFLSSVSFSLRVLRSVHL